MQTGCVCQQHKITLGCTNKPINGIRAKPQQRSEQQQSGILINDTLLSVSSTLAQNTECPPGLDMTSDPLMTFVRSVIRSVLLLICCSLPSHEGS